METDDTLRLIRLNQPITGFDDFISAWLWAGEPAILVDVGPKSTIETLDQTIRNFGVNRLDAILLTHIHIDHAGGIGDIAPRFQKPTVAVHPAGISHLRDPAKLWEGSLKVLGDTAKAYGPISPVSPDQLVDAFTLDMAGIKAFETPGHAPHHVSYLVEETLFAGEAAGVFFSFPDGQYYLRPATPPRFDFKSALQSLKSLSRLKPSRICFGHFGYSLQPDMVLAAAEEQLFLWKIIIENVMESAPEKEWVDQSFARLLEKDPYLSHFDRFLPETKKRESGFIKNSINGFIGYLKQTRSG